MSRFVVEVDVRSSESSATQRELRRRYPEIELVDRSHLHVGAERWTCVAPTATHLRRWIREQAVDQSSPLRPMSDSESDRADASLTPPWARSLGPTNENKETSS